MYCSYYLSKCFCDVYMQYHRLLHICYIGIRCAIAATSRGTRARSRARARVDSSNARAEGSACGSASTSTGGTRASTGRVSAAGVVCI